MRYHPISIPFIAHLTDIHFSFVSLFRMDSCYGEVNGLILDCSLKMYVFALDPFNEVVNASGKGV